MAIYFINCGAAELGRVKTMLVGEFGWREGGSGIEYFGKNPGESVSIGEESGLIAIVIPPISLKGPIPRKNVPEVFRKLCEILQHYQMVSDNYQPVSLSQLVQE